MSSAERDTARIDAEIWRRNHDSACRERDAAIERAERAELRYRNLEANMIASHAARDSDVKYMLAECDKRDAMIRELVEALKKEGHRPYTRHDPVRWPDVSPSMRYVAAYWCHTHPCDPIDCGLDALLSRATAMVETI